MTEIGFFFKKIIINKCILFYFREIAFIIFPIYFGLFIFYSIELLWHSFVSQGFIHNVMIKLSSSYSLAWLYLSFNHHHHQYKVSSKTVFQLVRAIKSGFLFSMVIVVWVTEKCSVNFN